MIITPKKVITWSIPFPLYLLEGLNLITSSLQQLNIAKGKS